MVVVEPSTWIFLDVSCENFVAEFYCIESSGTGDLNEESSEMLTVQRSQMVQTLTTTFRGGHSVGIEGSSYPYQAAV